MTHYVRSKEAQDPRVSGDDEMTVEGDRIAMEQRPEKGMSEPLTRKEQSLCTSASHMLYSYLLSSLALM